MNRLQLIRDYEKKYHDDCYENQILFQSGSWLEKPVRTVLDLFGQLERRRGIHALIVNAGVREVSLATGRSWIRSSSCCWMRRSWAPCWRRSTGAGSCCVTP